MKTFPEKIYVARRDEGGDEYLQINETVEDAAELGKQTFVGVYELKKTVLVGTEVKVDENV